MKKKYRCVDLLTAEGELLINDRELIPWNIYPRPHLERESFFCLNGNWALDVRLGDEYVCSTEIRVPFVPESILSGVGRAFEEGAVLVYKKEFSLPDDFFTDGKRVILHFGAVDQISSITLNSEELGSHVGGYDSFSFDVTDFIKEKNNVLCVECRDELEKKVLPYGKQRRDRGGMWYTPISGIWQTVWLECVPCEYVREIRVKTERNTAHISLDIVGEARCGSLILHNEGEDVIYAVEDGQLSITLDNARMWSPEDPYLYRFTLKIGEDMLNSYFALRDVGICEDKKGIKRLTLNDSPYFFHGLLDQGYFSDGIFLPASPDGYKNDILAAKRLGFNMLRKHIKVEPEVFYYYCDLYGIAVFQDMVNNSDYSFVRDTALPTVGIKKLNDRSLHRGKKSREAFLECMEKTVMATSFHPSVCYYTIFNEGWGQFDHATAYKKLSALDTGRIIDSVSGWFKPLCKKNFASDVESLHVYFKKFKLNKKRYDRPVVLSEFGGYSYKVEGHSFNLDNNYGYKSFSDREAFEDALERLYLDEVLPAIEKGLSAAVYTQISDVEDETNGLISYDRRIVKVDEDRMTKISSALYSAIK